MEIDLERKCVSVSVGEFSEFVLGPRSGTGAPSGLWRAQLGTRWHQQLREQASGEHPQARFEIPLAGELFHRGWRIQLQGRIDQWLPGSPPVLREVKTITAALPAADEDLRALYPAYFLQLSAYLRLTAQTPDSLAELKREMPPRGELLFLEIGSGFLQTVSLGLSDERQLEAQLERWVEFLELRWRSRERLRRLQVKPAFDQWRPAQQAGAEALLQAWNRRPLVCFEAPTGFGKTGVVLQAALQRLQQGEAERLIYLSAKATGQWQVMATLATMTGQESGDSLAAWQIRPKVEHCIHTEFRCHPELCPHLRDLEQRWPQSGLSRFFTVPRLPRDLASLREAGRAASLCPYEITRAALPFNEVWVGDMNYVFASSIRGLFFSQPGFAAERTLLVVDEAHHLPGRAAEALSYFFEYDGATAILGLLHRLRAPQRLERAWDNWAHLLRELTASESLSLAQEEDVRETLQALAREVTETPIDSTQLDESLRELFWQPVRITQDLQEHPDLALLWHCPAPRQLAVLCLDAGPVIAPLLRSFAGVVLTSATFGPEDAFRRACGLHEVEEARPRSAVTPPAERLGKLTLKETRKLFKGLQRGGDLLRETEQKTIRDLTWVRAEAPWREHAYEIAFDVRVDTRYQQREAGIPTTAKAVRDLIGAAPTDRPCIAVFFPSFVYAEKVRAALNALQPDLVTALQPRAHEKGDTQGWLDRSLVNARALFLVLGSSLAESIDSLGGKIAHAMVVGPALPEVNSFQRAKLELHARQDRTMAFAIVYQIPGMQRVNQALGRLVRAPGQSTRVTLHCQRFGESEYQNLLAPEYRVAGKWIRNDADWQSWLSP